jgi:quinol monooxygenase YgiN
MTAANEKTVVAVALFVRLTARPGMQGALEALLRSGLSLAQAEPATTTWFALRLGPSTFGIFDTFADESGRQAHLSGPIAAALAAQASDLLADAPAIEYADVLGAKLPQ